jgi:hypothetical protein
MDVGLQGSARLAAAATARGVCRCRRTPREGLEVEFELMDNFFTREAASSVFVSLAFKNAVLQAKLKGFDMSTEIGLTE